MVTAQGFGRQRGKPGAFDAKPISAVALKPFVQRDIPAGEAAAVVVVDAVRLWLSGLCHGMERRYFGHLRSSSM
jgi:hypothetical protein